MTAPMGSSSDNSTVWTAEQKQAFTKHIKREVLENDRWATYNNWWSVNLAVAVVMINGLVAIASTSATSTAPFMAANRPWFTYGAAVMAIFSGVITTILQGNRVGSKKLAYRTNSAELKQLEAAVDLDLTTKTEAHKQFAAVTSRNPEA